MCDGRADSKLLTERFKSVGIAVADGETEFVPSPDSGMITIYLMIDDKPSGIKMSVGNLYGMFKKMYDEMISDPNLISFPVNQSKTQKDV